jgi:cold-inducible RNA-binding protein
LDFLKSLNQEKKLYMSTNLYVGSLAPAVDDAKLKAFFDPMGEVKSAQVIQDRETNVSRGFGFVEMGTEAEAQKAIAELNGKDLEGQAVVVNEARPRKE